MSQQFFEETGGPHRGHAAGKTDVEKQASQLASDVKYKVKQTLSKSTNLNPAQVSKAYLAQLAKSPAPPAVKSLAKKKLVGENYQVDKLAQKNIIGALHKVFVEGLEEENLVDNYLLQMEETGESKVWIVVTDKKTGNTYRRQATRAKIAELRANPNISRVEITSYHPDKDDDMKGEKTAKVKAGKGLHSGAGEKYEKKYGKGGKNTVGDLDRDGTKEPDRHEYAGVKDNAIKKAMAKKKGIGEEVIYAQEEKDTKKEKQITGKGVNNKKLIKLFPDDSSGVKEEVESTTGITSKKPEKNIVDPAEKKQISTLQQFQRKEQQLNQQKLAAQKSGKIPVGSVQMDSHEPEGNDIQEVAPPGMEGTVKAMKKHPELSKGKTKEGKEKNIYALAWWMKGKGYKSHRKPSGAMKEETCGSEDEKEPKLKKSEGGAEDAREIPTKVNLVKNKFRAMGLKMSHELEGEMVDEAQAMGSVKSSDQNPKGAAVRVSSGRGMTMTPARGLGASKLSGDDKARAARQASQAKDDRRAAAKERAASGEDRLSKLIRSVQKDDFEPEGEVIDERTRFAKKTGKSFTSGKLSTKGGTLGGEDTHSKVMRHMHKVMGAGRVGAGGPIQQRGKKKEPGKKPPASGEYGSSTKSPAQKVAQRRASAQRAKDAMHSRFD